MKSQVNITKTPAPQRQVRKRTDENKSDPGAVQNELKSSCCKKNILADKKKFKLEGKTILIVENEESHLLLLKSMLGLYGLHVIEARDGNSALKICNDKSQKIDLVLMDIKIPDMDGLRITQLIKSIRKDLPVMAQTACAMKNDKEICLQAGCDDYIAKPISRILLVNKIGMQLNKK